ncbi:MAG: Aminoglycoside/hydroxyurea antibiotic resistance kinase [Propionibacteriaceae bacterium]|nr:Aminoglycoside/hydroxyurea antibiotic resistance kinase [Propionibacteriaceae bacterium]
MHESSRHSRTLPASPAPAGLVIPGALSASSSKYFGAAGRRWIAALPGLAADCLDRWQLRIDGVPSFGAVALVVPVTRADGTVAALKLQPVDEQTGGEAGALRLWAGLGAVRLLEHDAGSGSMLLDRLDAQRPLATVEDDLAALEVIAGLLARLNAVPAPPGLRRLGDIAAAMLDEVPPTLRLLSNPDERRLLNTCAAQVRELLGDPVDNRLLHWDLHYSNVLATDPFDDVQPWLAIDPKPLAGDPGFELLPALWNRWGDVVATNDVTRGVLRRFDLMIDILDLDWQRARAWTLARVLQNALWDVGRFGETTLAPSHRWIAESLLRRRG